MWRWSLARFIDSSLKGCILHVCGGDPFNFVNYKSDETYSPRMWRWSYIYLVNFLGLHVFSTYVEVILIESVKTSFPSCILHVCGGDPECKVNNHFWLGYSPRMWRWSYEWIDKGLLDDVFSTYVEVILSVRVILLKDRCILHVCGGDPIL